MVASYGETSGFSALDSKELALVNGGKGAQQREDNGSNGDYGSHGIPTPLDPLYQDYPPEDRPNDPKNDTSSGNSSSSSSSGSGKS